MARGSPLQECQGCDAATDPTTAYEEWFDENRPDGEQILCPDCQPDGGSP